MSNFAGDTRSQIWALGREVSNYLHAYLAEFIRPQTWADLEFIAVAKGPGGFTGTRLGIVTARTLSQQLDLPLFAISTLAAVAWRELATANLKAAEPTDIAVQMLAQRGELHGAIYGFNGSDRLLPRLPDSVISQERWQQILDAWTRPYRLVQVEGGLGATANSVLELAYQDWQLGNRPHWSDALPYYGQNPV